jgi:predicted GTPase
MARKRVVILGAAGRDFHNFNTVHRSDPTVEVVAFTATQIPNIDNRTYPVELAGKLYPDGIPILPEDDLEQIIAAHGVDQVVMAYSDLPYAEVMHLAARANAAGADFELQGTRQTFIKATAPVIAVTAVRTGCGKSQISRFVSSRLRAAGKRVAVVRHPMPYGDLAQQIVQRMASLEDIDRHKCTIEEREEYERHVEEGGVVYAGVDYAKVLELAESEADIVLWDGGNNDQPFYQPDLWITIADPLRAGHEVAYYPGEVNARGSDIIVVNKVNAAAPAAVEQVVTSCRALNPKARIIRAASALHVDHPELIKGKRVLAIEDGPTLTHGDMEYGAATAAAREHGAAELVDPRPFAVGGIAATFEAYPRIGKLLPAMGYWDEQVADLQRTINAVDCDSVVIGTPFNIQRIVQIEQPSCVVTYSHQDVEPDGGLAQVVDEFLASL